ncbi:hypothetical protein [Mucilaginibacter aquatilis]|uniref:Uncharacterized protein n=1 Tax=Mucilaginibacter aquatilis TaxID=1517760 RepID=A0A6I4I488_9SPHI|nr:hypothetical protein [Mucilaginibacter aquatilis]MVN89567.1 hypothetical protein [Mucilaginibacter aquatilis]
MITFQLLNNYVLKIEPEKEKASRLKLIVKQMGKELVCRKEGLNPLLDFLYNNEEHLFKGRLRLSKKKGTITVYLNDEVIGTIGSRDLLEKLEKL